MKDLNNFFEICNDLVLRKRKAKLLSILVDSPSIEVADFFNQQKTKVVLSIITQFKNEFSAEVFSNLSKEKQLELYELLDKKVFSKIFSLMSSQYRVDFYQNLKSDDQINLLPFLNKKIREDVITLSKYDQDVIGSKMSTDFSIILDTMNCKQTIKKIREDSHSKRIVHYIYVVNFEMKLIGFFSLKDLIISSSDEKIKNIMQKNFQFARVNDKKENVIQIIEKYNLVDLPIVNTQDQLVGILKYEDTIDIIREEESQDMKKFMGITTGDEENDLSYFKLSIFDHFKKRIAWIVGLFISSFISEIFLHKNSEIISKFVELSLYITMITGCGGNVGGQTATLVIRALSLEEIKIKDWFKVIFKEIRISILISLILFFLSYIKVIILSKENTFVFAKIVSISLSIQIFFSAIIGAILPFIAKILKGDPAIAASPAITTLVDVSGMVIYILVANFFLN
jgi:magnesium transporter